MHYHQINQYEQASCGEGLHLKEPRLNSRRSPSLSSFRAHLESDWFCPSWALSSPSCPVHGCSKGKHGPPRTLFPNSQPYASGAQVHRRLGTMALGPRPHSRPPFWGLRSASPELHASCAQASQWQGRTQFSNTHYCDGFWVSTHKAISLS